MNWDAVGAVAELLGAVAVVASLMYLAAQVRINTRSVRAASTKDAATTIRQWFDTVTSDPDLSRIFTMGVEGVESLPAEERPRFMFIAFNLLKAAEDLHYQAHHGMMDPELWGGWDHILHQYLPSPGIQAYWSVRRLAFSTSFRGYVDSMSPQPDAARADSLAQSLGH